MYEMNEIKNTKGLHFAHLNAHSLVNKWDNVKANFMDSGIHVLTFSETWFHNLLPNNLFDLGPDYTLIRNDRMWNDMGDPSFPPKKGGGVCMYISTRLQFSEFDFAHLNTSNKDLESQWVAIYQKPNKTLLIGNLYRPPQGNGSGCLEILENILSGINLNKIEITLIGDLNLDILDNTNVVAKNLINMTKQLGLKQLIKKPTRYSQYRDSCLDLIFTNSDIISKSGVGNVNISDHQIILMTRKKAKVAKIKCEFTGRSYRNYRKIDFQDQLKNVDWGFLNEEISVDMQWDMFNNNILKIMDKMCPRKTFKIKQVKQPWITPRLIELILDKDKALKKEKKKVKKITNG